MVFLDGSFASLVIYLNQATTSLAEAGHVLSTEFLRRWDSGLLTQMIGLFRSDRTVAVPKFTSRNELVALQRVHVPVDVDGKTLATLILEAGEYTAPLPILAQAENYHINFGTGEPEGQQRKCARSDIDAMNAALHDLRVIYFRPYGWIPALRLELPAQIASSNTRLSIVLEGVMRQFFSPAVIEPYPLFLADRMVKSLGAGVAVIEQAIAQHVASESADVEMTLLCLQNYRTEGGRGGV